MTEMNERISRIGVVPVIKLNHPERDAAELGKALCAGGVPVAEVTFRAAGAEIAIKLMKEANPDMIVGAGTVTNTEQIDKVIEAGGEFIVSPGFDPELHQVLPGRAERRPCENQGALRALPDVQGHAYRRYQLEESEGLPFLSGDRRLRRQLHGHRRPHRQQQVGRDHGALQEVP